MRMENRTLLVSYTDRGKAKMGEIRSLLESEGRTVLALERPRGGAFLQEHWQQVREIVFIGAAGIAVRLIAPYIRDKFTDPAVLVLDEGGRFVIPLLSGHVGGANDLARFLARATGAEAVITTATDVNGRFAVDVFAKKCGLVLTDRTKAKDISARILKGEKVGFYSEFPVLGRVPEELTLVDSRQKLGRFPAAIAVEERAGGEA
ncbi:cobalamin biosynthesis protein CbiG, partial [Faecalicatena contorta]